MATAHRADFGAISANGRTGKFFSQLSPGTLKDFELLEHTSTYPANAVLFLEKESPRGVFVLCEGQIKLSISSSDGKKLILRIVNAGELLDMTAAISGTPFETTAEALHICKVSFIHLEDFLQFLVEHPDAYLSVTRELSLNYQRTCEKLRSVVLSSSVPERLARLLLEWCKSAQETESGSIRLTVSMTHEEIGEFIGTTRETVTRTLGEFKHRKLLTSQGSTLTISDIMALQQFAGA
jgi:CRP/FNR family cyclic AMP-dependent transcriptional regulator